METFFPHNIEEWHNWLLENHQKKTEIWLGYYKKSSDKKGVTYRESLEEALCFGWIDGLIKKVDEERYVRRFSPRTSKSIWSQVNKDLAEKLLKENRISPFGKLKIEEAKQNGNWDKSYSTQEKAVIPEDLQQALKEIPIAWENFTAFTNSYQSRYIFWLNSAKRKETREKRLLKIAELAKNNIKPTI